MLLPRFLRFGDLDFSSMAAILHMSVYNQNEPPPSSSHGRNKTTRVGGGEQHGNPLLDTTSSMTAHSRLQPSSRQCSITKADSIVTRGHSRPTRRRGIGRKICRGVMDTKEWLPAIEPSTASCRRRPTYMSHQANAELRRMQIWTARQISCIQGIARRGPSMLSETP
jgi:hypothetical protein